MGGLGSNFFEKIGFDLMYWPEGLRLGLFPDPKREGD